MTWPTVFALHYAATLFMTGVIWVVQVVHYPLFARVGAGGYPAYQQAHVRLIALVVTPVMLAELATAVAWAAAFAKRGPAGAPWVNLAGLAVIWASTALLQVPAHERLAEAFDPGAHRRLVDTNWIRTIVWSARAVGLTCLAWRGWGR